MDRQRKSLLVEAANLAVGETSYDIPCPYCEEKSFSVTRNVRGLLFNCFRIKCGRKGFIPTDPTEYVEPIKHKVKTYEPIDTVSLDDVHVDFFFSRFGITRYILNHWGVVWAPKFQRVVFPIRDWLGREIGRTLRGYKELGEYQGSKTLHYKYSDSVPFAYYSTGVDLASTVVLVEDPVSCIKVTTAGYNGIALLGTNFSTDLMKFLHGKLIIVWLDNDAIATAVKIKHNYRIFFKDVKIVCTLQDPKDLPLDVIHETLH